MQVYYKGWAFLLLMLMGVQGFAQEVYLVVFDQKDTQQWDCSQYLSAKTIARRHKHGLPCHDHYDLPVRTAYKNAVQEKVDSLRHELRWFNAVSVAATASQIADISQFPFVKEIIPLSRQPRQPLPTAITAETGEEKDEPEDEMEMFRKLRRLAREQMQFDLLKERGLTGKGLRIAIFDAGFRGTDDHPGLAHLIKGQQIVMVKDFFGSRDHVYYHNDHGTSVLSCLAGRFEGEWIGAAQDAEFMLARTESIVWERRSEEDYWMAAAEWAERNGADIISSSLGYTDKRYEYADMNGQTTLVTNAARVATRKGVLVVNSLGNEGDSKFHYLSAPSDADSVLAVGATYPMLPLAMNFSSFGPNARGITKPDVTAPGYIVAAGRKSKYKIVTGTSFSCPLVAGLAACLMQEAPEATNMDVLVRIRKAGHLYPYYDFRHGFGVPGAKRALMLPDTVDCNLQFQQINDTLIVAFPPIKVEDTTHEKGTRILYFHQEGPDGKLMDYRYAMTKPKDAGMKITPVGKPPFTYRIWFGGCLYEEEWKIKEE